MNLYSLRSAETLSFLKASVSRKFTSFKASQISSELRLPSLQTSNDWCVKETKSVLQLDGDHVGEMGEMEDIRQVVKNAVFASLAGLTKVFLVAGFGIWIHRTSPSPLDVDVDLANRVSEFDPADGNDQILAIHIGHDLGIVQDLLQRGLNLSSMRSAFPDVGVRLRHIIWTYP